MFEDALNELANLQRRLQALDGEHQVTFQELFTDEFMLRNTDHPSIQAMFEANSLTVNSTAEFEALPESLWAQIVRVQTRFSTWDEMKSAAAEQWAMRQLGYD